MKGLINFKTCFFWCHIKHVNPLYKNHQRITKADTKMVNDLDYEGIEFHVSKKDYCKIEKKNNIDINVFSYENNFIYTVYVSGQIFEDHMDLLLITDKNKSHYVYCILTIFKNLYVIRQNVGLKHFFENIVYNVLLVKKF